MPLRYLPFALVVLLTLLSFPLALIHPSAWLLAGAGLILTLLGWVDLRQPESAVRRNYPLIGRIRFYAEDLRPFVRQYFVEDDDAEVPFSHAQRSVVYQRSQGTLDKLAFGTEVDVYKAGFEWINHSLAPIEPDPASFRIRIGGERCSVPYSASVFNISAMSFGSLSANAVLALSRGAAAGGFYQDTGEGGLSPYHLQGGADLVWEIGSGYFGCRDEHGRFSPERFAERAAQPQVRMIELKLSQGAKPGHGGILPGAKVTAEIAAVRAVPEGQDCVSPAAHSAFATPLELLAFVDALRELSGGKPVGFKLAIGHPWEWFAIVKAMLASGRRPDFIVVDGAEGGTGAAPPEFADHVGLPLREGLLLVHNTLVGAGLRDQIRIGAAGKVITAFDLARTIALGADWCNAARGFMFALGCIQSQQCHTDRCPSGVATQDPARQRGLDPMLKSNRVQRYHQNTLKALAELLGAAGLAHPGELGPEHILRRLPGGEIKPFASLYTQLAEAELLRASVPDRSPYREFWASAAPDSFAPPAALASLRTSKSR
jgi:glutamate synthase domain-containing protein 2